MTNVSEKSVCTLSTQFSSQRSSKVEHSGKLNNRRLSVINLACKSSESSLSHILSSLRVLKPSNSFAWFCFFSEKLSCTLFSDGFRSSQHCESNALLASISDSILFDSAKLDSKFVTLTSDELNSELRFSTDFSMLSSLFSRVSILPVLIFCNSISSVLLWLGLTVYPKAAAAGLAWPRRRNGLMWSVVLLHRHTGQVNEKQALVFVDRKAIHVHNIAETAVIAVRLDLG